MVIPEFFKRKEPGIKGLIGMTCKVQERADETFKTLTDKDNVWGPVMEKVSAHRERQDSQAMKGDAVPLLIAYNRLEGHDLIEAVGEKDLFFLNICKFVVENGNNGEVAAEFIVAAAAAIVFEANEIMAHKN
jgi:hypothetical protein